MRRIFDSGGLIDDATPPMIFRDAGASHAKVKARDIVLGWPMSRSVGGGFNDVEVYELAERFNLSFLRSNILDADYVLWMLREIQETVNYHRDQEKMTEDCMRSVGSVEMFRAMCKGEVTITESVRWFREPGYWMHETSGELEPVVKAFLNRETLTADGVTMLKLYFRQWIYADPWQGAEVDELRRMIDEVVTQDGLDAWAMKAMDAGCDPL